MFGKSRNSVKCGSGLRAFAAACIAVVAGCSSSGSEVATGEGGGAGSGSSLTVGDDSVFEVVGPEGGPFPDGSRDYELINGSQDTPVEWEVVATVPWLRFSDLGGTIGPDTSIWITVSIDQALAAKLAVDSYPANIIFSDARQNEIYLAFLLTVIPAQGGLTVMPEDDVFLSADLGVAIDPVTYTLGSDADEAVDWEASVDVSWLVLSSPWSGTLQPGESLDYDILIDEVVLAGLGAGVHVGFGTFTEVSPGSATHVRRIQVDLTDPNNQGRITDSLVVLYDFEESGGTVVRDVGGVGAPLDLTIDDPARTSWMPGALRVDQSTALRSGGAGTKLHDALTASEELTFEAWIDPANLDQDGPARIVTLSGSQEERNVTLGQGLWNGLPSDAFNVRLRTTTTDANGDPMVQAPGGSAKDGLQHLVGTFGSNGIVTIYVDALKVAEQSVGGSLSAWDPGYGFALANEFNADRPWLGSMHLVAVYDRALSAAEVKQNFDAGTGDPDVGHLVVTPSFDFSVYGVEGISLSADAITYTLSNPGTASLDWEATVSEPWVFVDGPSGGTLNPDEQADAIIRLDVPMIMAFSPGVYTAILDFTNQTTGFGDTRRDVIVTIKSEGGGDKPGPHNTGPYDESVLVPSGQITVTQDGALIENFDVTSGIKVYADNVLIRNCRVNGGKYGIFIESGQSGVVIEDCEIFNVVSTGIYGPNGGWSAYRCNIHESQGDGVKMRSNTHLEACWIHHLGTGEGSHADANQTRAGSNIMIVGNNMDIPIPESPNGPGPPYKSNACSINSTGLGHISNIVIDGNWLNGGNYTIYFNNEDKGFGVSDAHLTNNRFGRDYRFGVLSKNVSGSKLTISGNVWDDTGELMDIND